MAKLYLVRHGQAAAGFDEALDPGLSDVGRRQAQKAAEALSHVAPSTIVSSPMLRCQETAVPLAEMWDRSVTIVEGVTEIPSPTDDVTARSQWLRQTMMGHWSSCEDWVLAWHKGVADALLAIEGDAVVFTHFIAINAAVGRALGDDRVVVFRPDNGSITVLETNGNDLRVVELGREADTKVG